MSHNPCAHLSLLSSPAGNGSRCNPLHPRSAVARSPLVRSDRILTARPGSPYRPACRVADAAVVLAALLPALRSNRRDKEISFLAHREAMVCSPSSVNTTSFSGSAFGGTAALRISRTPLLWRAVAASACPAHHALKMWPVVSGAICSRGLVGCSLMQIVQCLAALLPILYKNAPDGYE